MVIDWLINRAKRTPYFHLEGYMNRWWLVPYKRMEKTAKVIKQFHYRSLVDVPTGTGPVAFRRRPIAWVLQQCSIAVRVHEILRSDEGRHPHNHPWPYVTIILRNRYRERRFDNRGRCTSLKVHGPGSILFRPAGSWHMLELIDGPVTTLFITGKKSQSWGYNVDGEQINHLDYDGRM